MDKPQKGEIARKGTLGPKGLFGGLLWKLRSLKREVIT